MTSNSQTHQPSSPSEQHPKIVRLIPALDVLDLDVVDRLAKAVGAHEMIYGFKVGFSLGLTHGLGRVVEVIRRHSGKPIIYDHQKAATDIPDTGRLFARTLRQAGINEAILFPQAGPATLDAWIDGLREESLKVIVGGLMTHKAYVKSEGGFLEDQGIETIYRTAVERGVRAFVVPLTKPAAVDHLVQAVPFPADSEFYSPGFGRQGGDPGRFARIRRHYLIVGRALLEAADPAVWLADAEKSLRSMA
jgi:orotidine-5'-phosphate decarboxylase